ncbi:hypothetical protein M405DRAFT_458868 [Rhizopogon salebrosus TDB-379]|nr:hypothetical protein M405DRAFT_458868 [Rhizopogon salebrosus TDB-379]
MSLPVFPVVFPSDQSSIPIAPATKIGLLPLQPWKYRCHLCCRLLLSLVISILFSDHPFLFPPTYLFSHQTFLNGYLLALVSVLIFPGGSAMYFFLLCSILTPHVLMHSLW